MDVLSLDVFHLGYILLHRPVADYTLAPFPPYSGCTFSYTLSVDCTGMVSGVGKYINYRQHCIDKKKVVGFFQTFSYKVS
jgi:hypothetical protein